MFTSSDSWKKSEILSWSAVGATESTKGIDADAKSTVADKATDSDSWMNRFAALSLEETTDINETEISADASTVSTDIIRVEAVEKEEEDYLSIGFFRLLCLLHDLQKNWREFLSDTWTEYNNLEIDLGTASVITDTALQLAKELIQDTLEQISSPFPKDSFVLQQVVCEMAVAITGRPSRPSTHLGLPFDEKMGDIIEWSFLSTRIILESFSKVIKDGSVPLYKPGYYGTYNPKADRSNMSEKFNVDKILMLELLPEYSMLGSYNAPLPVQDEITSGLLEYIRTKKTTLWLSFATQVMLDSIHATRHSRLGPAADLRMTGLRTARTIDDYLTLLKTHPKPQFWPKEGDNEIKAIRDTVECWIENDPLLILRQSAAQSISREKGPNAHQLLFSRNPIF